jgi:anthranilate phosphoribosyltransferase
LTALRVKGETIDEITAAATVMREKAEPFSLEKDVILDTCGTGGDSSGTINISTGVAVVTAAAGIPVAKHGNRAATSKSGSADVLKALGINIDLSPDKVKKCIDNVGIGFLFAPNFHKAMKYAGNVRKEIGIRTIFNILGPLTNPAKNTHHLMGVFSEELTETMAGVLKRLGSVHALVVCGEGGVDEIILSGYTKITELKDGNIKTYRIRPSLYDIKEQPLAAIHGGSPEENAAILVEIFEGRRKDAYYDAIVINSGYALYTGDKAANPKEGMNMARTLIAEGKVMEKLNQFRECSNK